MDPNTLKWLTSQAATAKAAAAKAAGAKAVVASHSAHLGATHAHAATTATHGHVVGGKVSGFHFTSHPGMPHHTGVPSKPQVFNPHAPAGPHHPTHKPQVFNQHHTHHRRRIPRKFCPPIFMVP